MGLESVQQLQQQRGPLTQRHSGTKSSVFETVNEQSHVPKQLTSYLTSRIGPPRPSRLTALSARVKHDRKLVDTSIAKKKIRQFSLFPQAKSIIEETKKYKNLS